jgi:hypothetical protein
MNNPVSIKPVIVHSAGQPETAQVRKADLPTKDCAARGAER